MLEKVIQTQILNYLEGEGVFCWRNNTGGFKKDNGHFYSFGKKGSGDIIGIYKGRFLSIEVKNEKGRVSDSQKEFIKKVNDEGGIAFVARSVEVVENYLKSL